MKLAFCLFKYFPFGGLQRDFMRIAKECIRRGHSVDVYTMRWEGELDPQLSIHIFPPTGWQNHGRIFKFIQQIKKDLTHKKYDRIIGFNKMSGLDIYFASDTCYQAKARRLHGAWYRLTKRYRQYVAYEKAVFAAHAKTKILLLSKLQQPEFMHFYQTEPERFYLLPPGIEQDRQAPMNAKDIREALRQEFHIQKNDFVLLMIGSGFKTKGLDRILKGIAALPHDIRNRSHLFIIGQDNQRSFLKQAKQLQILERIKFLGGRNDVPRFLLGADLLLHPAYSENTGAVLLEALVAGLPVLTTDVCGYAEYIEKAHAGVVLNSPFQQEEFNQALVDMLLSPEREIWSQNALAFSKAADIYNLTKCAVDLIEK